MQTEGLSGLCQAVSLSFSQKNLETPWFLLHVQFLSPPLPWTVKGCTKVRTMPEVTEPLMLSLQLLGYPHTVSTLKRMCQPETES